MSLEYICILLKDKLSHHICQGLNTTTIKPMKQTRILSCGKFESEKTTSALAVTVFKYNFALFKTASAEWI